MRLFYLPDGVVSSGEFSYWLTFPFTYYIGASGIGGGGGAGSALTPVTTTVFQTPRTPNYITVAGQKRYAYSEPAPIQNSGAINNRCDDRYIYINYYRPLR